MADDDRGGVVDLESGRRTVKAKKLIQSSPEFVADYRPPDYLIQSLLQRRYVYSITGHTGSGKTSIALRLVMHVRLGIPVGHLEVVKGRTLYFAGENPDDVRSRWIKLCEDLGQDPTTLEGCYFMPGVQPLSARAIQEQVTRAAEDVGPISLVVVDTAAAYFTGTDENDSKSMGDYARLLRDLVKLRGGPTVLITCHPSKYATNDSLLPRGAGAFLAEVDGNLACMKERGSPLVEIDTHGKWRGPEFQPIFFRLHSATSERLRDSHGNPVWTVTAEPVSDDERERLESVGLSKQDELLLAMHNAPGSGERALANALNWRYQSGDPNKSLVRRLATQLHADGLTVMERGRWTLTAKGRKSADALRASPSAEGAPNDEEQGDLI